MDLRAKPNLNQVQRVRTVILPNYCHRIIDDYTQRWGIETLFGIFKSRGFDLEDTHLLDSERLSRLFSLLTIALCWAYPSQWLSQAKPNHKLQQREISTSSEAEQTIVFNC